MSDQIVINITPDPSINLSALENNEKIELNGLTLNQGIISHSVTHEKNGSDELLHNLLGGLDGGQSGQYYHMTQNQYENNVYSYDLPVYKTGDQTISGSKSFADQSTFLSGVNFSGSLFFDKSKNLTPLDGEVNWSKDYGTLQIGMNDGEVIQPVGFKSFYRVKAQQTIRKGKVCMVVGAVGNSEFILAQEAFGIGSSGELIIGVAAENIPQNEFGDIVAFGPVRGVNTSTFPIDSILYYDPNTTGGLTNQIPQAPNAKVIVGLNTTASNNGIIFVRVIPGSQLGVTDSNVNFVNLNNNDFLFYNSGIWSNKKLSTGDVSGISNYSTISFTNELSGYLQSEISELQESTGFFYPVSNPSGFITGIDLSDYYTTNEINSKLSNTGQWNEAYSWGNHALEGYVTGAVVRPSETGVFVTGEVVRPSETGVFVTGAVVRPSETGVFVTGAVVRPSETGVFVTGAVVRPSETGVFVTGAVVRPSETGVFVTGEVVRPSETGVFVTGEVVRPSETGVFVTGEVVRPSETGVFVTGEVVRPSETGVFVTGAVVRPSETGVFITQSQTGQFYSSANPSGFVTGPVVRPSETGVFVTGEVVRPSETGMFITQSQTGQFYSSSNPSGFTTGGGNSVTNFNVDQNILAISLFS
jgi:hypothetical protein